MFKRAGEALGADWTLHDLRHTAAYRMARDPAMPLADVQWILGHARLSDDAGLPDPGADEVVAALCAHSMPAGPGRRCRAAGAGGYRPGTLEVLFGTALVKAAPRTGCRRRSCSRAVRRS